ncbi:hypothetical protein DIPPA_18588 [Diplonema papillatum]|nr:hypothetical protein DIPPA_18588 [Diplonema papillatum]
MRDASDEGMTAIAAISVKRLSPVSSLSRSAERLRCVLDVEGAPGKQTTEPSPVRHDRCEWGKKFKYGIPVDTGFTALLTVVDDADGCKLLQTTLHLASDELRRRVGSRRDVLVPAEKPSDAARNPADSAPVLLLSLAIEQDPSGLSAAPPSPGNPRRRGSKQADLDRSGVDLPSLIASLCTELVDLKSTMRACPPAPPPAPPPPPLCRHCGADAGAAAKFCWHCGCDLSAPLRRFPPPPQAQASASGRGAFGLAPQGFEGAACEWSTDPPQAGSANGRGPIAGHGGSAKQCFEGACEWSTNPPQAGSANRRDPIGHPLATAGHGKQRFDGVCEWSTNEAVPAPTPATPAPTAPFSSNAANAHCPHWAEPSYPPPSNPGSACAALQPPPPGRCQCCPACLRGSSPGPSYPTPHQRPAAATCCDGELLPLGAQPCSRGGGSTFLSDRHGASYLAPPARFAAEEERHGRHGRQTPPLGISGLHAALKEGPRCGRPPQAVQLKQLPPKAAGGKENVPGWSAGVPRGHAVELRAASASSGSSAPPDKQSSLSSSSLFRSRPDRRPLHFVADLPQTSDPFARRPLHFVAPDHYPAAGDTRQ